MTKPETTREHYVHFFELQTRWMDNDIYGHVNNVTYYSYFDTVANRFLIEQGGLNIHTDQVVGFVVASQCDYLQPISFPQAIEVGFRVNKLGNSSVEYGMAIFCCDSKTAAAIGSFTHVFVDQRTSKSVPIPATLRSALQKAITLQ